MTTPSRSRLNRKDLWTGCLCALSCESIFGLSYIFTKSATANASGLSLLGWRFLIAFLCMTLLTGSKVIPLQIRGKNLRPLLRVAFLSPVIYFTCETLGIRQTTASESGVFLACIPVASLLASTLILKEKPSKAQTAGILITLGGVLMTVFAAGASSRFSATGYLFLLGAVLSYALYCVFVEKAGDYTGIEITYCMLAAGALVFCTLALLEAVIHCNLAGLLTLPFRDFSFLLAVLYQGIVCSVLAFFLSNVAIAKIGVNRTSSFIGLSTVVSMLSGIVLLQEKLGIFQVIGALIIIAGVTIANRKEGSSLS